MRIIGNNPAADNAEITAVASGTLANGDAVVVNADGTVSVISGEAEGAGTPVLFQNSSVTYGAATFDSNSNKVVIVFYNYKAVVGTVNGSTISFGATAVFDSVGAIAYPAVTFDSNSNKVVIAYNTSTLFKAVVGTVSGTDISFGTPVSIHGNYDLGVWCSATFDSNSNKVVISYSRAAYPSNTYYGTSIVGTVSGTSISFGTPVVFNSARSDNTSSTFDSNSNKVVIAYSDLGNLRYGKAVVGTVSGTGISFGSVVTFEVGQTFFTSATFDSNANKVVIAYTDNQNSAYLTAVVGTVSGTSISFGTPVVWQNKGGQFPSAVFDSNSNKVVIAYYNTVDTQGEGVVGTVSGTSISFGTPVVFNTGNVGAIALAATFDSTNNKVVVSYQDAANSNRGTLSVGAVSGTSISFGTSVVFESGATYFIGSGFDSNSGKIVIPYADYGAGPDGTVVVFQNESTNLTSENYIGMSPGSVVVNSVAQSSGTPVTFESGLALYNAIANDSANNKVVIAYQDSGNSGFGTAIVGTTDPSDNSISFGTPVVFESANTTRTAITYDVNAGKLLISYNDDANSGRLTAIVGTVSGTGISFGTAVVVSTLTSASHVASTYDANAQKVVVVATLGGTPSAFVGTISGTSVSFGSRVSYGGSNGEQNRITYDANAQKVVAIYNFSSSGRARVGTVSGTSISFGTEATFNTSTIEEPGIAYDASAQKVVIAYKNSGNSDYGTAIVGTVSGTDISFGSSAVYNSSSVGQNNVVYDSSTQRVVIAYQVGSTNGSAIAGEINGTSITFNTATVFQASRVENVAAVYDSTSERVVIPFRDQPNATGDAVVFKTGYTAIIRGQVASGGAATVDIVGTVSTNQLSLTAGQQYFVQTDGTLGLTAADPSVLAGTAISATKLVVKT